MFNFWWSAEWSKQKTLTKIEKNEKSPLSHQKLKCSSKIKMFIFGLCSTSDDRPSNPGKKCWPKQKKQKRPPKTSKNKMFIFGLHSTSDDRPGWLMDSNPVRHPSPARKIKCSFLDYVQLLMISWAGRRTQTPSATPLQSKK